MYEETVFSVIIISFLKNWGSFKEQSFVLIIQFPSLYFALKRIVLRFFSIFLSFFLRQVFFVDQAAPRAQKSLRTAALFKTPFLTHMEAVPKNRKPALDILCPFLMNHITL